ncbi:amidase signature domain-containing protein [Diaporthe sp. PMI_573]|nr:amidase signature domain-containing protein [Diaporthaceae sp. PMI_573]
MPPGSAVASLDLLTVTSTELQQLLSNGSITSAGLVTAYVDQIELENHNGLKLNAMISITPYNVLQQIARDLDIEREQGAIRSPLHGIPSQSRQELRPSRRLRHLPTTVGTHALQDSIAKRNAPIVDRLVEAGAIILGKANLSEMTGWKGFGAPGGSSSGSAAGVAAGFAPLALATETDGSIVQPANRAVLYGLKATVGLLPTEGTAPWSSLTDSIGGMAKSPQDLAALFEVLTGAEGRIDNKGDQDTPSAPWTGQRVGFVDLTLWSFSPVICDPDPVLIQQQREEMDAAFSKIEKSGAVVVRSVPFPSMDQLVLDGDDALEQLWNHDFSSEWEVFLKGYQDSQIVSLRDVVEFNKQNADKELPPRKRLFAKSDAIDETKRISSDKYHEGVRILRQAARTQGIDEKLAAHNLDVILGPMDGRIPTIAATAGYPVGTMPLGYSVTNGRPFGMCTVAAAGQEDKILRAMRAWDATIGKRKTPPHTSLKT